MTGPASDDRAADRPSGSDEHTTLDRPSGWEELAAAVRAARDHLAALVVAVEGGEVAPPDPCGPPVPGAAATGPPARHPGWLRPATGEERWPPALAVGVAIALQLVLPARLAIGPRWLLPALEAALAVGIVVANPRQVDRRSRWLRGASVAMIALVSLVNAWSSIELIRELIGGSPSGAGALLATGASIYVTNIIVFGLWYWECDRAGPVARAHGDRPYPDLLFPQMGGLHLAPPDWRPTFIDYLYVSYTNATAFSPTDTMPMARWTKLLFLAQSAIALTVAALVIARAVNILR